MGTSIQNGYIMLADITGFDAYLAGVELDHAQGVLRELLELIVDSLQPPMALSSVKGDAALLFAAEEHISRGETLLELTETTYLGFRDRIKAIHRNNTCHCRACDTVPTLDLKFMVHYGEYTVQPSAAGGVELGGLHANLVRQRLLKDQVNGANGWRAYSLFTGPSLEKMGVRPEDMKINCANYPDLGEIETGTYNLEPRYEALTQSRHAYVDEGEAEVVITHTFAEPPRTVWEWLNDPDKRTRWLRWTTWQGGLRPGGRTGIGARNHCAHGIGSMVETILDWRPYSYFTVEMEQTPGSIVFMVTYELEQLKSGGTSLILRSLVKRSTARWLIRGMAKLAFPLKLGADLSRMEALMSEEKTAPEAAV